MEYVLFIKQMLYKGLQKIINLSLAVFYKSKLISYYGKNLINVSFAKFVIEFHSIIKTYSSCNIMK